MENSQNPTGKKKIHNNLIRKWAKDMKRDSTGEDSDGK